MSRSLRLVMASWAAIAAVAVAACTSGGSATAPTSATLPTTSADGAPTRTLRDPLLAAPVSAVDTSALGTAWSKAPNGCISVARHREIIFEVGGDLLVPPASTVKLATAAAAIDALGPAHRLRTAVVTVAPPDGSVVEGDLWLVGGGDPVLGTDAWAATMLGTDDPRTSLDALADSVVAAGVRRINGGVAGDDSRYDRERYVSTWPRRLIDDGEVGPLSALSVNDGFRVWGHPGVPFTDPPAEAAAIFTELLRVRGVSVAGEPRAASAPAGATALAVMESPPLGDLVAAMLRDSDNGTADLLVKEIGLRDRRSGTTPAGLAAVSRRLAARGVRFDGSVIGDGSGVSDAGQVRCRFLVAVLVAFRAELDGGLAVAAESGTLRRRLVGTPAAGRVRAKTGSIDGVSALAGFADGATTYSFAMVVTGLPPEISARRVHDAVVLAAVAMP